MNLERQFNENRGLSEGRDNGPEADRGSFDNEDYIRLEFNPDDRERSDDGNYLGIADDFDQDSDKESRMDIDEDKDKDESSYSSDQSSTGGSTRGTGSVEGDGYIYDFS